MFGIWYVYGVFVIQKQNFCDDYVVKYFVSSLE